MLHGRVKNTSPPYADCFVYYGAFTRVDCEERRHAAAVILLANGCTGDMASSRSHPVPVIARRLRRGNLMQALPAMSLRGAQRRGRAAVRDEGALRMRHTLAGAISCRNGRLKSSTGIRINIEIHTKAIGFSPFVWKFFPGSVYQCRSSKYFSKLKISAASSSV